MKKKAEIYEGAVISDKKSSPLDYNRDGDELEEGLNLRAGLKAGLSAGRYFFYINPEASSLPGAVMKKAYAKMSLGGLTLQAGRDSAWWGPGSHGSLLLSNNARPLNSIRLGNDRPAYLPWLFKYLGPFRFSAFASRLEKDRADVPEPYLWGLRLNFKPSPYVELGLQRTALLGGKGRNEDADAWWSSLTGRGENDQGREAGDQKAGLDMKLTLPFKSQPVQLYAEAVGEDSCGGLPCNWAYLGGFYLPRPFGPFGIERLDIRAEYAVNHVEGEPNIWYSHHIYTSGYTYHGRIIGHHMGTDSEDYFLEFGYRLRGGRLKLLYDRERHGLSDIKPSRTEEVSARGEHDLSDELRFNWEISSGKLNSPERKENLSLLAFGFSYSF